MKHKTKDGPEIEICDMDYSHLVNTIKLIRRKADEGLTVRYGGGTTADDMWYDEDVLYGVEALDALNYNSYISELNKRARQDEQSE